MRRRRDEVVVGGEDAKEKKLWNRLLLLSLDFRCMTLCCIREEAKDRKQQPVLTSRFGYVYLLSVAIIVSKTPDLVTSTAIYTIKSTAMRE